ncbi:hypothetical protein SDC9_209865 [bioreactor metagenome]|uniref:Uncharacterized protein n=1 Tax=bioreactor metagenome TaxID=1076179 RepID=A0A645JEH2_9ZZZZ
MLHILITDTFFIATAQCTDHILIGFIHDALVLIDIDGVDTLVISVAQSSHYLLVGFRLIDCMDIRGSQCVADVLLHTLSVTAVLGLSVNGVGGDAVAFLWLQNGNTALIFTWIGV